MRTRTERRVAARYRWDRLKVSFWFTPALMALGAVLLAWFDRIGWMVASPIKSSRIAGSSLPEHPVNCVTAC